ncbi:hypothetical protein IZ6_22780 [Terrihabitans soli]|uniref:Gamma-glutamylcyclotransferase AIG2-like domain-containing protein n=1 Tax=Terrihabitans soli TaxID=708113 RepID=A0A6S6QJS6_9HYPH|nr:gamma-glutamylcyclotransferase family protein [Terrihabitans soli]BCJ91543.1 hypothetical protein IZ6_22780 [Terrihabitans soli]
MPLLFSYGTLQQKEVQLGTFGRELGGTKDVLPGYALSTVLITHPDVVALSGMEEHLIVRPGKISDEVSGTVFEITAEELTQADSYETDDYERVELPLASGLRAFVYVAAQ